MGDLFTHVKADLKSDIHHLLITKPELRDNDNALVASIWRTEMSGNSLEAFFLGMEDPKNLMKLSSFKSIVRYRAMIQEEFEALRGKRYMGRKDEALEITHKAHSGGL